MSHGKKVPHLGCHLCLRFAFLTDLFLSFAFHLPTPHTFIQYSGGQASEGQGGFYGSGGARHPDGGKADAYDSDAEESRSKMLALAADVNKIRQVMDEYTVFESLLAAEDSDISNKSIELKSAIKKLMTAPEVLNALNRLEIQGEPVWGLSTEERELIVTAREIVNEC